MTTTHPGVFEGDSFEAPNGFKYDSQAAWYITRWAHIVALGRRDPRQMDQLVGELIEFPCHDVTLANVEYQKAAVAVFLEDGSRVIMACSKDHPDSISIHRLTGEAGPGCVCYLDWGYDPPVASIRVPLEGNMNPPVSSLEIG